MKKKKNSYVPVLSWGGNVTPNSIQKCVYFAVVCLRAGVHTVNTMIRPLYNRTVTHSVKRPQNLNDFGVKPKRLAHFRMVKLCEEVLFGVIHVSRTRV